jgi:chromosome segregation ATPase
MLGMEFVVRTDPWHGFSQDSDCCDGSDEWDNPSINCNDTCAAEAAAQTAQLRERIKRVEAGVKLKAEAVDESQNRHKERKRKLAVLKEEVKKMESSLQEMKSELCSRGFLLDLQKLEIRKSV